MTEHIRNKFEGVKLVFDGQVIVVNATSMRANIGLSFSRPIVRRKIVLLPLVFWDFSANTVSER